MDSGIVTDAVMFFDNNIVVKEMLYLEFEAILDHVVGIQEFSDQQTPAAFVQINSRLQVVSAVFFTIGFDSLGYADRSWNIPLKHLADHAGRGPDLGAGRIKLSCRSQCSVSWHQRSLWDPDMESGSKTLDQIASVAKRNRLGVLVDEEPVLEPVALESVNSSKTPTAANKHTLDKKAEEALKEKLQKKFQKELTSRLAEQGAEHKLRVATMKSETHDHVEKLHANYRTQITKINEVQKASKQLFTDEKHKNQKLKKLLDQQAEKFHKDRENYQRNLSDGKNTQQGELEELKEKFELELKASVDNATAELKERLDMREVELFYRDEQIGRLHEDIIELRKEKQQLIGGGSNKVLKKLAETGITFVAYHPGVDHLTIPIREMAQYLESPTSYAAEKCDVDLELYNQWKAHYELPVCNHKYEDDTVCAVPINKVEKPSRFIVGESDCCAAHNGSADMLAELMKMRETS
jgi:hypothetical protein